MRLLASGGWLLVTTGLAFITGTALFGVDLSNDHPISMTYDVLDTGLNATSATSGLGGTIATDMLFGGNVECASCHDVHDDNGIVGLLKKSNAGSDLCTTCHNK